MTKADKIRRYFAKGMTASQIVKKLKCRPSEVYRLKPKDEAKSESLKRVKKLSEVVKEFAKDPAKVTMEEAVAARDKWRTKNPGIAKVWRQLGDSAAMASLPKEVGVNAVQIGGEHYKSLDPQPWDVINAWGLGFLDGNVVKYVARFKNKGGVEDLKKAKHYLDKLIEVESGRGK